MKKVFNFIFFTTKTGFFLVAAVLMFFGLWYVNACHDPEGFKWHDVIVESHGMLFDLFVFGIVLSIYEWFRERKEQTERILKAKYEKIERLHEEIDDYRGWREQEAAYRIAGAIRRLNRVEVYKVNLSECYLVNANLEVVNLQNANLLEAELQGAKLNSANLSGADLMYASLRGAQLRNAIIKQSDLSETSLADAILEAANFQGSSLRCADLQRANLEGTNLEGCDLRNATLFGVNLKKASIATRSEKGMRFLPQAANLTSADLRGAMVDKDFLDNILTWEVLGAAEINRKYMFDSYSGSLKEK